jgi:hypothetical protein
VGRSRANGGGPFLRKETPKRPVIPSGQFQKIWTVVDLSRGGKRRTKREHISAALPGQGL